MPCFRLRFRRRVALGVSLGIAAACTALPALADSPVAVTFQASNPWTQEVGSVDRRDASHDYSVAVAAGKTLQINLVTRDPNVFFKVRDQTRDKQLVDTYKTGATTWSSPNPTATSYLIHVYVDPYAMQRGEEAKYALQIGHYGPEDMQAATTAVTFQGGNPWVQQVGTMNAQATSHDYTVAIAAGNTLQVNLIARTPGLHFKVENQADATQLVDTASTGATTWSTSVAAATTYTIHVYVDPAAVPPGKNAQYALQIGQYPAQNAGAAATPAPASTQAPTAGVPASAGAASR
ncbi:MAG TPA: hypothetical protein VFP92_08645 [Rhodanobacteraceae bacterium]|nr:hypothetical protein [Rhodanobacteraceae bacterium]